jgi:hypothetical protein
MQKQPKTKRPGRPRLPKGNAKARFLRVRMTPDELKIIETTAKANSQTVSQFVRCKLLATEGV